MSRATSPAPADRDKLAGRLAKIFQRLARGERLSPPALAQEFGVSVRTIQRDLHQRFDMLGLVAEAGHYRLPVSALGRVSDEDLGRIANALGQGAVFPSAGPHALRAVMGPQDQATWALRPGLPAEDAQPHGPLFIELERAVRERRLVGFRYGRAPGKVHEPVQPYQQLHHNGIWYLVATEGGRLKTFALGRMSGLLVSDQCFEHDAAVQAHLAESRGIWFQGDAQPLQPVRLWVAEPVARYWLRRPLVPRQTGVKVMPDGALQVSCDAAHALEILPVVRYWIPHVRVLSPVGWQQALEASLREYLGAGTDDGDLAGAASGG